MSNLKVVIIGGGAAGYFAALSCKAHHPDAVVTIIEKTTKVLSKVKISGGGRCNVTNAERDIKVLSSYYPRGGNQLRKLFSTFNTQHTIDWFESRGVALKTYEDGHIFPVSNDSQTIIDCFQREVDKLKIRVLMRWRLQEVVPLESGFRIEFEDRKPLRCDKIIVATGGHPKRANFDWMEKLGHKIEPPVPSLFTFNIPDNPITDLMGVVMNPALVRIQGTKLKGEGPLLVTHWGMSGPAILKMSAWGARVLAGMNYQFKIQVNWVNQLNENLVRNQLEQSLPKMGRKLLKNMNPWGIPTRLWVFLLKRADIDLNTPWGHIGKKVKNRMLNVLINDIYEVRGKTTFKEEFVTCGGVSLSSLNMSTMESKVCPGMYFAGEVIDIDGLTGGYNFQAAWTTAFVAGKLVHK